ncbi:hypothetical protein WICMUC_004910 [Wickerhamomyces mucosus]|uniref:Protein DOA1 n=1 Tax=Wickerhamomyces mucosus TaxID=1378264 RepID=A0A9P8PFE3_9ASCO|nr:hypothetical protein WICMUC_004910 [Wickerhamomyces mucosus]
MAYKLSATLEGHEDDVKAVVSPFNDTIISASRDSTVRVWSKNNEGQWDSTINFKSNAFINSLTFDAENNLVISGGQDKLINITDLYSSSLDSKYVLIGHDSNVCALDSKDDQVISGSWDTTAKVWENNILKYTLEGHNASVWGVKILSKDRFLTSSADRTIKLWDHDKEIKNFVGHKDVVRGLTILPYGFASTSNDGTIRVSDFDGNLINQLIGHESFVYSVQSLSNGDIVSSGEDRTVRIWRNGKAIQVITLPSISIWSISVLPNDDIVTGGSDNTVRIFTTDPDRIANNEELIKFKEAVENIAINSQSIDDSKISPPEALEKPGTKEGQVIIIKSYTGINEAHQWSGGIWLKIGEVVGSAGSSEKKTEFDGKKWDYVFDVDIQDGVPPLKLPYNVNENPYVAAQRFLERNELPSSYTDDVVQFITKNTSSVGVNSEVNPYVDSKPKIIPQTEYLGFTTNNYESIFKGLKKFNTTFSTDEIDKIETYFINENYNDLLTVATKIIENWDNKLVGFDILRLISAKLDKPPIELGEYIKVGLNSSNAQIYFITFRFLSNIFLNKNWGEAVITDSAISTSIINLIEFSSSDDRNSVNISNAISTLLLNFSIYAGRYKVNKLAETLVAKLNTKAELLAKVSSESAYRLSVAYGNLIYVNKSFSNSDYKKLKVLILQTYQEDRFKELFNEIDAL